MGVSRVEYDAALQRVVANCCDGPDRNYCARTGAVDCFCRDAALAALGLDEPPTEVPLAVERAHIIERLHKIENGEYSVIEMAHDLERLARHPVWEASNKAAADVEAAYDRGRAEAVVPPSETPKACPTITVAALREWIDANREEVRTLSMFNRESAVARAVGLATLDDLARFLAEFNCGYDGSGIDGGTA